MARFEAFVAIDWSGAVGERQKGIAVARCGLGREAPALVRPGHVWSRAEVLDWLLTGLPKDTLIGFDLSTSLAFADCGAYFPGWAETPPDARALWALVDAVCADDLHLGANSLVDHPQASPHFRRPGGRTGAAFGSGGGRLRVVEAASRAQGLANPVSNFNLVGAAQVGKASLTGMRLFHQLAGRLAIWPYDPHGGTGHLIVEMYTSIAAVRAGLPRGRSKMRDAEVLDAALARLGTRPHTPCPTHSEHAADAILSAAWLRHAHADEKLWTPAQLTPALARTEGWTFGVG